MGLTISDLRRVTIGWDGTSGKGGGEGGLGGTLVVGNEDGGGVSGIE